MASRQEQNKAALARCRQIADRQYGVIERSQAIDCCLSRRALERLVLEGEWERVAPRVYRIAGSRRHPYGRFMVLSLWMGAKGVVSHTSAAALWQLRGLRHERFEVTLTSSRKPPHDAVIVHQVQSMPDSDMTVISGIRTTTAARTICDVAGSLARSHLEIAVDDG
jgi:predicted transcriptional regulator of viral defense system